MTVRGSQLQLRPMVTQVHPRIAKESFEGHEVRESGLPLFREVHSPAPIFWSHRFDFPKDVPVSPVERRAKAPGRKHLRAEARPNRVDAIEQRSRGVQTAGKCP